MIDELITALENLQEAKAEYKEAAKNCEYDRSYFLHREIKAVDDAKEELARIFRSAVASVVVDVINNKSYLPE
jgi:hypothetical protein